MSEAATKFITDVALHFTRPKFDGEASERAWFLAMVRNMRGFSPEILRQAAQILIDQRADRRFPLPKECKDACFEAVKILKAQTPRLVGSQVSRGATNDEREALAYELILGPLGKRAAREGWVHSLFTWTRDHMRLPESEADIQWCINSAKGFDREFERCRAAVPGSMQAKLAQLGFSMLAKREALETYVQTGVLP